MTDPVETLARALYGSSGLFFPWDSLAPEAHEMFRTQARSLLTQITPALVAEAVDTALDAAHDYLVETYGSSPLQHPVDRARIINIIRVRRKRDDLNKPTG